MLVAYGVVAALAWAGSPAVRIDDTYRYLTERWPDFSAVLEPLNGGVATALLYAVVRDPVLIAGTQVLAFAAASALLALAVIRRLRGHWTGWLLAAFVLVISLLPVFWSSHLALASESLMFTAAMLWLASVVWLTTSRRGEIGPLVANAGAIAILALARPQAMLALVPAQFVILVWWGRFERSGRAALTAMASMVPFAAFAGYRVWQVAAHDRWPLRYALHNLVAKDSSFREYALARMPECGLVTSGLSGPAPWPSTMALETTLPGGCPDTFAWLTSSATMVTTWVREVPTEALSGFAADLPRLALVRWTDDRALPAGLDEVLMPGASPWLLLGAALVIGMLLAAFAGVRPRVTVLGMLGLLVSLVPIIAFLFAVWAVDGLDFGRHVFPFLPFLAVAALVLPATIPSRPDRPRRARLSEIATTWTSRSSPDSEP